MAKLPRTGRLRARVVPRFERAQARRNVERMRRKRLRRVEAELERVCLQPHHAAIDRRAGHKRRAAIDHGSRWSVFKASAGRVLEPQHARRQDGEARLAVRRDVHRVRARHRIVRQQLKRGVWHRRSAAEQRKNEKKHMHISSCSDSDDSPDDSDASSSSATCRSQQKRPTGILKKKETPSNQNENE